MATVAAGLACGDSKPEPITESRWDLVVFGDSTLWGAGKPYAEHIEQANDVEVVLHDEWQGGLRASTLLSLLQDDDNCFAQRAQNLVRDAEVVVYFGNPVGLLTEDQSWDCGEDGTYGVDSCDREGFGPYQESLQQIAARIKELRKVCRLPAFGRNSTARMAARTRSRRATSLWARRTPMTRALRPSPTSSTNSSTNSGTNPRLVERNRPHGRARHAKQLVASSRSPPSPLIPAAHHLSSGATRPVRPA